MDNKTAFTGTRNADDGHEKRDVLALAAAGKADISEADNMNVGELYALMEVLHDAGNRDAKIDALLTAFYFGFAVGSEAKHSDASKWQDMTTEERKKAISVLSDDENAGIVKLIYDLQDIKAEHERLFKVKKKNKSNGCILNNYFTPKQAQAIEQYLAGNEHKNYLVKTTKGGIKRQVLIFSECEETDEEFINGILDLLEDLK